MFSKFFYLASLNSYYTFYLINRFHVSVESAEMHLFAFLGAAAAGTIIGGPIGDRIGRKNVIWCSILGVLPFTLALPYSNLFWTGVLSVIIGLILASAFSAIVVYAQELVPGRVGMISGLFFGIAFGLGGVGAAFLGKLADESGIYFVYQVCAFLPAIGLLTGFLPNIEGARHATATRPLVVAKSVPGIRHGEGDRAATGPWGNIILKYNSCTQLIYAGSVARSCSSCRPRCKVDGSLVGASGPDRAIRSMSFSRNAIGRLPAPGKSASGRMTKPAGGELI